MTDSTVNSHGGHDEHARLVSYLYDELEPLDRARFEEHLSLCAACSAELATMREVRVELTAWQLPEDAGAGTGAGLLKHVVAVRPWWAPAALAAAAVILLAAGAAIANLEIRYGRDGVSVRAGWSRTPVQATAAAVPSHPSGEAVQAGAISARDLEELENRLRTEFRSLAARAPATQRAASAPRAGNASADAQLLQRVRELIDQSETRQRRELALRVAQVVRDFDAQRQTDLVRIQQGLGQIEGSTAADRQLLNYLVRVSQRQR